MKRVSGGQGGSAADKIFNRMALALVISLAIAGCKSKSEREAEMNAKIAEARVKLDTEEAAQEAARVKAQGAKRAAAAAVAQARLLTLYKSRLVDPESAQFRSLKAASHDASESGQAFDTLCGEVNAKNRMGGYVGFTMFAITQIEGQQPLILSSSEDGPLSVMAIGAFENQGCKRE
jgi:hypothetical protein